MEKPYFAILNKTEVVNENGERVNQVLFFGSFNTYEKALEQYKEYERIFHHSNTKLADTVQADPTGEMCIARISPMSEWTRVKDL